MDLKDIALRSLRRRIGRMALLVLGSHGTWAASGAPRWRMLSWNAASGAHDGADHREEVRVRVRGALPAGALGRDGADGASRGARDMIIITSPMTRA